MRTIDTPIDRFATTGKKIGTATLGVGALATAGLLVTPVILTQLAYEGLCGTARNMSEDVRGRARGARKNLSNYLTGNTYQTEQ